MVNQRSRNTPHQVFEHLEPDPRVDAQLVVGDDHVELLLRLLLLRLGGLRAGAGAGSGGGGSSAGGARGGGPLGVVGAGGEGAGRGVGGEALGGGCGELPVRAAVLRAVVGGEVSAGAGAHLLAAKGGVVPAAGVRAPLELLLLLLLPRHRHRLAGAHRDGLGCREGGGGEG